MTEENKNVNIDGDINIAYELLKYFEENPFMLVGVALSAASTGIIMTSCLIINKKLKGEN